MIGSGMPSQSRSPAVNGFSGARKQSPMRMGSPAVGGSSRILK